MKLLLELELAVYNIPETTSIFGLDLQSVLWSGLIIHSISRHGYGSLVELNGFLAL